MNSRLISAEWMKLHTTRLLVAMVTGAVALSIAAVAGTVLSAESAGVDLESSEGLRRTLHVTGTGAILILVVGIVMTAGEYRTRTATDTFLTTPRRTRVFTAKLAVGVALGLVTGTIAAAIAATTAWLLYPTQDARFPLDTSDVWSTLTGTLLYTMLFAALGIAVGTLVRNQVAAIVGALIWFAVIEQILINLAPSLGKWLPGGAGQAILRAPIDELHRPAVGAVILATYAAAIATVGLIAEARRDT
jgi:ABC-2 type transport system permease protein